MMDFDAMRAEIDRRYRDAINALDILRQYSGNQVPRLQTKPPRDGTIPSRIMCVLTDKPVTVREIAKLTSVLSPRVSTAVHHLYTAGKITRIHNGRGYVYSLRTAPQPTGEADDRRRETA